VGAESSVFEGFCGRILSELEANDFGEEDIFAVHLGLEEAFINAVKHGNKAEPTKKVRIDYSVRPEEVEIFITDEGEGFEPELVPDPRCGDNIYKIGGRGLFLIRVFMDLTEFNKRANCIRMVKYNSNKKSSGGKVKKPIS